MKLVDNSIIQRILNINMHDGVSVKNVTTNTMWIFFEKGLRIIIAFFVTPMVTNYLGLTSYGQYMYITTYYSLFFVFVDLGLGSAIVKEFVKYKDNPKVQGSLFFLKVVGSIVASLGMFLVVITFNPGNRDLIIFVGIICFKLISLSVGSVDFYLQANSQFKWTSIIRNIAYIIVTIFQIVAIIFKFPLIYFIIAFVVETILLEIGMIIRYYSTGGNLFKWKVDFDYLKQFLKEYYPIIVTALASVISLRISQVLIGELIDKDTLGVYSVTVKLTEIWYFIIGSVNAVLIPIIFGKKETGDEKYQKYMQRMINLMTWVGISVTILVIVTTQIFLRVLYDPIYWNAGKYVFIYAFNALTSAQAVAINVWYLSENLQKQSMYQSIIGLFISLIFNFILIKSLGAYGAAISTIITSIFVLYIIPIFVKTTRPIPFMVLKSFNITNIFKDIRIIIKDNQK